MRLGGEVLHEWPVYKALVEADKVIIISTHILEEVEAICSRAVIIAGVLCGIAGAFISTSLSSSFVRDMTAGSGFMALAALIFANWRAYPALGACLLFGFLL